MDVPDARISTQVSSWSAASENIEHSQRQNQQRARQTCLAPILKPGDHVAVKVEGHVGTFKPLWADFYVITKSKHPTYYIRHLVSGKERVLHREKLIQLPKADPSPELKLHIQRKMIISMRVTVMVVLHHMSEYRVENHCLSLKHIHYRTRLVLQNWHCSPHP